MKTLITQVKAFKEIKDIDENHLQINFRELSNKYGFDVKQLYEKRLIRHVVKISSKYF